MKENPHYTKEYLHDELQALIRKYKGKPLYWMISFTMDISQALLINNLTMLPPADREDAIQQYIDTVRKNLAVSERLQEKHTVQ